MIKVHNNIATREPIPQFLRGLAPESLADLSWTDPALGVSDAAWWPEDDQSPALGEFERYGAETLTVDADRLVVVVVRDIVPWSDEEIAAHRKAMVPGAVTMRQARIALSRAGLIPAVEQALATMEGQAGEEARIEWDYSSQVFRHKHFVIGLGASIGLTEDQIDELFITAAGIE